MKYWEIIGDNLSKAGWSWVASQALRCAARIEKLPACGGRIGASVSYAGVKAPGGAEKHNSGKET
jgi:hypothetical protein